MLATRESTPRAVPAGAFRIGARNPTDVTADGRGMKPPSPRGRPTSVGIGRAAEALAARWYEGHGYVVVDRNVRLGPLEIDLIVADANHLVFVEVRARRDLAFGHPAATVDGRKRGRVRAAAARWLATRRSSGFGVVRFDVVAVVGVGSSATIAVYENAF